MSEETNDLKNGPDEDIGPDEAGTLSVEDDPDGTVDPADLAGTAGPDDDT